jgi:3',5'-nucleoside bisphosphate phosphatase
VIDLHLHTTASDGRLTPSSLVTLAAKRRLRIISVTDHDTVAGLDEARDAAVALGIRLINGIEVTAVEQGRDVHVLGYFFDPSSENLARFLHVQRESRIERVREIAAKLQAMDLAIDVAVILDAAAKQRGRSIGRPALADALVIAGHAVDRQDAFDRFLAAGKPAFVPRCGPELADVVSAISGAGGIASLAHPGLNGLDGEIPRFARSGLSAIEARHRDHPPEVEAHYRRIAETLGLAVSGGSDFHGEVGASVADVDPGQPGPGSVSLTHEDFTRLEARLQRDARKHAGMH